LPSFELLIELATIPFGGNGLYHWHVFSMNVQLTAWHRSFRSIIGACGVVGVKIGLKNEGKLGNCWPPTFPTPLANIGGRCKSANLKEE